MSFAAPAGPLDAVVHGIVERLQALTGADGASLLLPDGDRLRVEVTIGRDGPMNDVLLVPLVVGGETRGVLTAQTGQRASFDESDVASAKLLAQCAEIALAAQPRGDLAGGRSERMLREIVETQREISELAVDLRATTKAVVERCQSLAGADAAGIEWVEDGELVLTVVSGAFARFEGLRMRIDDSLSGVALETGALQVCRDAETDPRVDAETCRATGVRSFILAPLHRRGRIAGNLCIASAQPDAFDEIDVETTRLMSAFVSAAIQNAEELAARQELVEALRESEARFRGAFDAAATASALVSLDGVVLDVNDGASELLGYAKDELVGLSLRHFTHPDDVAADEAILERLVGGELDRHEVEKRNVHKDGRVLWVHRSLALVRDRDGNPLHLVAQVQDLTARKESEELFAAVFRSASSAKIIVDDARRFVDVNPAACELLGYTRDELLALRVDDIAPADAPVATLWQAFLEDGSLTGEVQVTRRDGTIREVEVAASANVLPGRHLAVADDVTARKELEQQLRQAQKMEAIGRLAGGVAHDFNNLLTAIGGYSEFLIRGIDDERLRRNAEEIKKAADRAAALTSQLLAFSRRQMLQPRVLELNAIVVDMQMMLRRLIGEDVELVTILDPALGSVRADPSRLEQVIVNLAVNAREAMHGGGTLRIETAQVEGTDGESHVALTISDTGVGMTDEERQKLFEPFFTTKPDGTGLGLSTVYGIVEQSGGTIEVETELGVGSKFRIVLPCAGAPEPARPVTPDAEREDAPGGTILLVEDEAIVRRLVAEMLESAGYEVLEAPDADAALELVRRHADPIDLLVTDVVMPGMNGRDIAAAVTALRPAVQVLYMSGYTDSVIVDRGVLDPDTAFLQKPFSAAELITKVRSLVTR